MEKIGFLVHVADASRSSLLLFFSIALQAHVDIPKIVVSNARRAIRHTFVLCVNNADLVVWKLMIDMAYRQVCFDESPQQESTMSLHSMNDLLHMRVFRATNYAPKCFTAGIANQSF